MVAVRSVVYEHVYTCGWKNDPYDEIMWHLMLDLIKRFLRCQALREQNGANQEAVPTVTTKVQHEYSAAPTCSVPYKRLWIHDTLRVMSSFQFFSANQPWTANNNLIRIERHGRAHSHNRDCFYESPEPWHFSTPGKNIVQRFSLAAVNFAPAFHFDELLLCTCVFMEMGVISGLSENRIGHILLTSCTICIA